MAKLPWFSVAVLGAVACNSGFSRFDAAAARDDREDAGIPPDTGPTPDASPVVDPSDVGVASPDGVQPGRDAGPSPDERAQSDAPPSLDQASKDLAAGSEVSSGPDTPADSAAADRPNERQPDAPGDAISPDGRTLAGCPILPPNHIFNTPIADLPVHPSSADFMDTIGAHNIRLVLGKNTDMTSPDYRGIPYNIVAGNSLAWTHVSYSSVDPDMSWDPRSQSDCVDDSSGASHTIVSPCQVGKAPNPWLPIPASPLVEDGIDRDPAQPYGDHRILILDSDSCRLWELYHCYPGASGGWDIFGSATFDLRSNRLRRDGWTSTDGAGFPVLPLLLRASEASSGEIRHALRFTVASGSIRFEYVWPARHLVGPGTTSPRLPPMGQLFRLKASYQIPSSFGTQSRAILQALKTYGMYIAASGSTLSIHGDPSADWQDSTFPQVQSVGSSQFEAVDLSPIMNRPGFDSDSGAVPPP